MRLLEELLDKKAAEIVEDLLAAGSNPKANVPWFAIVRRHLIDFELKIECAKNIAGWKAANKPKK